MLYGNDPVGLCSNSSISFHIYQKITTHAIQWTKCLKKAQQKVFSESFTYAAEFYIAVSFNNIFIYKIMYIFFYIHIYLYIFFRFCFGSVYSIPPQGNFFFCILFCILFYILLFYSPRTSKWSLWPRQSATWPSSSGTMTPRAPPWLVLECI